MDHADNELQSAQDLEGFVAEWVRSASHVMRARIEKLAFLRAEIARGIEDIDAGRVELLTDELLERIADRAKATARPTEDEYLSCENVASNTTDSPT